MTNKGPRGLPEEWMGLDVRSSSSSSKTFSLILDQQFADYGLAEAVWVSSVSSSVFNIDILYKG